jgi:acyl-CoA thioester hydrolase
MADAPASGPAPLPGPVFHHAARVYGDGPDGGGVVYHGSYVRMIDRARAEWLHALGIGQQALREADVLLAVRAMELDFRKPARLDDALDIAVRLVELRPASLTVAQELSRKGECLLTARVRLACLQASTFRPRALPDGLAQALRTTGGTS